MICSSKNSACCFHRTLLEKLLFQALAANPNAAPPPAAFRPSVAVQQIFSLLKQSPNGAVRLVPLTELFDGLVDASDLEAKLKKAASSPLRKRWERMQELGRSISPADATNALALAEKALSRNEFWGFRYSLMGKWAEADPQALPALHPAGRRVEPSGEEGEERRFACPVAPGDEQRGVVGEREVEGCQPARDRRTGRGEHVPFFEQVGPGRDACEVQDR